MLLWLCGCAVSFRISLVSFLPALSPLVAFVFVGEWRVECEVLLTGGVSSSSFVVATMVEDEEAK